MYDIRQIEFVHELRLKPAAFCSRSCAAQAQTSQSCLLRARAILVDEEQRQGSQHPERCPVFGAGSPLAKRPGATQMHDARTHGYLMAAARWVYVKTLALAISIVSLAPPLCTQCPACLCKP